MLRGGGNQRRGGWLGSKGGGGNDPPSWRGRSWFTPKTLGVNQIAILGIAASDRIYRLPYWL